jgi:hypothetical protein
VRIISLRELKDEVGTLMLQAASSNDTIKNSYSPKHRWGCRDASKQSVKTPQQREHLLNETARRRLRYGNGCGAGNPLMKYVERKFSLRVRKTDGTAKLLVGVSDAGGVCIGKLIKIPGHQEWCACCQDNCTAKGGAWAMGGDRGPA